MSVNNIDFSDISVLVTGGAGFIGSHIVENLISHKVKQVTILDNLSTGYYKNIEKYVDMPNVKFVEGDITDIDMCRKCCAGMDVVCHQAALGSVPRSVLDPLTSHNSNVNGFLNILLAARENNINRVVYASSSSVYGTDDKSKKSEDIIGKHLSPYAVTKYIDELYASLFTKLYNMECIGLRYFNVFGDRQPSDCIYSAVIPKFFKDIINNRTPLINGDGTYSRDFTHVSNVVVANLLALTTKNKESYGQVFNVGTGGSVSINELFRYIKVITNKPDIVAVYGPCRIGDVAHSSASVDKIKQYLGYEPVTSFIDGLISCKNYYESI